MQQGEGFALVWFPDGFKAIAGVVVLIDLERQLVKRNQGFKKNEETWAHALKYSSELRNIFS